VTEERRKRGHLAHLCMSTVSFIVVSCTSSSSNTLSIDPNGCLPIVDTSISGDFVGVSDPSEMPNLSAVDFAVRDDPSSEVQGVLRAVVGRLGGTVAVGPIDVKSLRSDDILEVALMRQVCGGVAETSSGIIDHAPVFVGGGNFAILRSSDGSVQRSLTIGPYHAESDCQSLNLVRSNAGRYWVVAGPTQCTPSDNLASSLDLSGEVLGSTGSIASYNTFLDVQTDG
jgi:hypothetical protein